jgi:hypothetical protein
MIILIISVTSLALTFYSLYLTLRNMREAKRLYEKALEVEEQIEQSAKIQIRMKELSEQAVLSEAQRRLHRASEEKE